MHEIKPVLLVEDNPKDAELTLAALADSHLLNKITHVKDGAQVMEYLRCQGEFSDRKSGNPAVVILDVKMPRMDGIGVLRAIRADPILDQVSVVMLTSSSEEQDLIRSYELGVNAYVLKPVKFSEFVDAVKHLGIFWAVLNEAPPEEVFVR